MGHDLEVAKRAALDRVTLMETWGPAQLIPPDQVQAIIGGPGADLFGSAKIRGKTECHMVVGIAECNAIMVVPLRLKVLRAASSVVP